MEKSKKIKIKKSPAQMQNNLEERETTIQNVSTPTLPQKADTNKKQNQSRLIRRRARLLESNPAIDAWKKIFTQLDPILINRILNKKNEWILEIASRGLAEPTKAANAWFYHFQKKMILIGEEVCRKHVDDLYHFVLSN